MATRRKAKSSIRVLTLGLSLATCAAVVARATATAQVHADRARFNALLHKQDVAGKWNDAILAADPDWTQHYQMLPLVPYLSDAEMKEFIALNVRLREADFARW